MKRSILAAALVAMPSWPAQRPKPTAAPTRPSSATSAQAPGIADAAYDSSSDRLPLERRLRGSAASASRTTRALPAPGAARYGAWSLAAPDGTEIIRAAARVSASSQNFHVPQVQIGLEGGARELLDGVQRQPPHRRLGRRRAAATSPSRLTCLSRDDCGDGRDAHIYMRRIALTLRDLTASHRPARRHASRARLTPRRPGARRERHRPRIGRPLRHGRAQRPAARIADARVPA